MSLKRVDIMKNYLWGVLSNKKGDGLDTWLASHITVTGCCSQRAITLQSSL